MKKLSLILLIYLGLIGTAFADHSNVGLDKLKATNDCEFCHLKGTDLSGAILCNTKMPNGDIDNSGC